MVSEAGAKPYKEASPDLDGRRQVQISMVSEAGAKPYKEASPDLDGQ
jgi:hypothetical protein